MEPQPTPRRFYSDGRGIWYIDRIWPLVEGLAEEDLPIESVKQLDEVCWFDEKWGVRPTCRQVIDHCRRILVADLSYPIILVEHDGEWCVLDGVHRVAKALLNGQTTVRAVRLHALPEPDEVLSPADPRYKPPEDR